MTDANAVATTTRHILIGVLVVVILLPLGILLARYGTVSPCQALRQEFRARVMREMMTRHGDVFTDPTRRLEAAGAVLGMAVGQMIVDSAVETRIGTMGPLDCTHGLINAALYDTR